jgi:nucleoside-diphosphate-sugar epimerase
MLSARGAELYLAVRSRAAAEAVFERYQVRGEVIEQDLTHSESLFRLLRRVTPSIVFNLAGYGVDPAERDPALADCINHRLIGELCRGLAEFRETAWPGAALVHTGSALEYGTSGGDLAEDVVPQPLTLYGQSKLAGTLALASCARKYGLAAVTARLFTIYGPGEHAGRLLPSLMRLRRSGASLDLTAGLQQRDFTHVEEAAEGLLRLGLCSLERGVTVNLATGCLTSVRAFAETAAAELGIAANRLRFGALPARPEEMVHLPVAVGRLRRLTGWVPGVTIAEGIRRTIAFDEA